MIRTRQRRLALMFILVLAAELVLLCCASAHLADHACSGHDSCAICAFVSTGLRRAAVAALALTVMLAAAAVRSGIRISRRSVPSDSPVMLRVRLND